MQEMDGSMINEPGSQVARQLSQEAVDEIKGPDMQRGSQASRQQGGKAVW